MGLTDAGNPKLAEIPFFSTGRVIVPHATCPSFGWDLHSEDYALANVLADPLNATLEPPAVLSGPPAIAMLWAPSAAALFGNSYLSA